jgi:hypothetical protein
VKRRRLGPVGVLVFAGLAVPTAVLAANYVDATANCDLVDMHVGETNNQYGNIFYKSEDFWIPKTAYYTTVWEYYPFDKPTVTGGDAPHGNFYVGTDPDLGHTVWRQDGTFTVWGDASKSLSTRAKASLTRSTSLVGTTTGPHQWSDKDRCKSTNGWVRVTS